MVTGNPGNMKTMLSPRLPRLPIFVDCDWYPTRKDVGRILIALRHRDRLRGIIFRGPDERIKGFFKELKRPFPVLEILKFYRNSCGTPLYELCLGSAPRLRCLQVDFVPFRSLAQLLSSSTMLVELSLNIEISPQVSLLPFLQAMPHLRCLVLKLATAPNTTTDNLNIVTLSKLTSFRFHGLPTVLDTLVAGLTAPSLHSLHIRFTAAIRSPLCHLPRFTTEIESRYHACQSILSKEFFCLSLQSDSVLSGYNEPHFKILSRTVTHVDVALASKLDTVEELFIALYGNKEPPSVSWWRFLRQFQSLKVLKLEHEIIFDVANSLRSVRCEDVLGLLPALEEIQLRFPSYPPISSTYERYRAEMEAFQPFVAAYKRAGRPVNVSCGPSFGVPSWMLHD